MKKLILLLILLVSKSIAQSKISEVSYYQGVWGQEIGANPLLLIDEKEYPITVLREVNPAKLADFQVFYGGTPMGNRFGEKAKEGVISLKTQTGSFSFDSEKAKQDASENILQFLSIREKPFYRVHFKQSTGEELDIVGFKKPKGGSCFSELPKGEQVLFLVNGKAFTEEEAMKLEKGYLIKTTKCGAGEVKGTLEATYGEKGKGVKNYIEVPVQ
ncbi:MAG: hypothetical protein U0Y10_00030 [Spirosomataceae bacterium]